MKEASKPTQISTIASDLRALLFSLLRTRRTKVFLYGIAFGCVAFTAYLAFCLPEKASPWFNNLPYRSQISSLFSYIFHNSSSSPSPEKAATLPGNQMTGGEGTRKAGVLVKNRTRSGTGTSASGVSGKNEKEEVVGSRENLVSAKKNEMVEGARVYKGGILEARNQKGRGIGSRGIGVTETNRADSGTGLQGGGDSTKSHMVKEGNGISTNDKGRDGVGSEKHSVLAVKNQARRGVPSKNETTTSGDGPAETGGNLPSSAKNQTRRRVTPKGNQVPTRYKESTANPQKNEVAAKNRPSSGDASIPKSARTPTPEVDRKRVPHAFGGDRRKKMNWTSAMEGCDIFQGRWVKDDSYPLYPEGSCPHIDEPFDCYHNGRPDRAYQKLRWQPNGCNIPRLNATDMLERLRGRRLVFVGDSLNRNMWESLVCVLRNSVRDKRKVFEASGRHEFRTDGSYSFVFEDFNCSVEFFRTPFLVQEWEMPIRKGRTKETLRLDIVERSSSMYKDAYVIIFNTGHWWTHEKTAKGKDYYQEGRHIYSELNVEEAFHKALRTWAKWVDTNVNPMKSLVFFRGYSASHFSGGQWNSGGQCDKETSPIENDEYLSPYPSLMTALESVIKGMKTPVSYLNITRMSDYRKDAHPSIYRKQDLTEEERRDPERFQDCSHWCLPGVPDSWNEILYAQLIIKQHQLLLHAENKSNM